MVRSGYCPALKNQTRRKKTRAFSLIEVSLALAIAAFCLIVVFGLVPIGITTNRESVVQSTAASLSSSIVADLRGAPESGAALSPRYGIALPNAGSPAQSTSLFLSADGATNSLTGTGLPPFFRATVTLTPPASGRAASSGRVWITWPALADADPATMPSHYSGSYLTVIGLDRN